MAAAGLCDVAESCDGDRASCPADGFVADAVAPAGTVCDDGGCCGAGGGRASLWLGLVVLGLLNRRRVPRFS